jgi:hypothetical protein
MTGLWFRDRQGVGWRHVGTRFWVRLALAVVSVVLLVGTVAWPDWIEIVFRVDPDHGSGWLEWAIVAAAFALMVTFSVSARREWRRASRPAAVGAGAS